MAQQAAVAKDELMGALLDLLSEYEQNALNEKVVIDLAYWMNSTVFGKIEYVEGKVWGVTLVSRDGLRLKIYKRSIWDPGRMHKDTIIDYELDSLCGVTSDDS